MSIRMAPAAIAVDATGNPYLSEQHGGLICRVDLKTGLISRYAGPFGPVSGMAFDAAGNLLFSEETVRKVDGRTQTVTQVAGSGQSDNRGDNGPAIAAALFTPPTSANIYASLALDQQNNLYISDPANGTVRKVEAESGIIRTVDSSTTWTTGMAVDASGTVFLGGFGSIWRLDPTGALSRFAGRTTSNPDPRLCQQWDGQPALEADLGSELHGLAFDRRGDLLIPDTQHQRIRKVQMSSNILTTVAGSGSCVSAGYSGDAGPATNAQLYWPWGIAVDREGNLFIAEFLNRRIRKVDATTGIISTVVELMDGVRHLAVDSSGILFYVDLDRENLVKIEAATGKRIDITMSRFQEGTPSETGDDVPASRAVPGAPAGIVFDSEGSLWVADTGTGRVRVICGPL